MSSSRYEDLARTLASIGSAGLFVAAAVMKADDVNTWGAAITGALLLIASLMPKGAG